MSTKPSSPAPYKPEPITGYTEWLPEVRLVELRWLDHIRSVFESYGFCCLLYTSPSPRDS